MTDNGLQIVDPLQYPRWDDLLLDQETYSFFHSSAWARVLSESYRYRPCYFCRTDGGKVSALVPVMDVRSLLTGWRGVALPFTDYCEPVADNPESDGLMDELIRFGKLAGWSSVEMRPANGFCTGLPIASSYYVHTLDLTPGADRLFSSFHETTRKNIRKALREGVQVRIDSSADALAVFYELNCRTRRGHGLPPQPYSFFRNVHEHVVSRNLGFVALGSYRNHDIAGAVYFLSREKTIYKYGASLSEYQRLRANNLVMWESIQHCLKLGQKSLCFGRTDLDHSGLRNFKAGWGAAEKIIHYYKYDLKKESFVEGSSFGTKGIHTAIYRRMPVSLLKMMGRVLYRHVG